MKNRVTWLMVALALTGVAGGVYAQTTPSSAGTAPSDSSTGGNHQHWHPHRGGMMGGMMMHTLHQLNLTDAQKQSVHSILLTARNNAKAQHQSAGAPNFAALANPGDPNHGAALQDLLARMTARIQARDAVQQQIYGVLTQDQKTQLASIIAAKQAKWAQHGAS
ncbi:MAG TPA: Spy/CpxP family protein refolding chaperone [Steroidobacteraceae bacterium]|jgi:Spy/CpxP family protein refolding chaperone|nr:Spy/CpxP family protein refolding chaperone [Steroidobacteraceae bacterium]